MRTLAVAAFALCFPVLACAQEGEVRRQINVQGIGEITATPDIAFLSFSVVSTGKEAGEAFSGATTAMNRVIDAMDKAGIERRDRQTSSLNLSPVYARTERFQDRSRIEGYEARSTLTVRLRDIEEAGDVIDRAVRAGANGLESFRLGFDDASELENQARVAAVEDAMAKAQLMAKTAGASLGPVISLSEQGGGPRPVAMAEMRSADAMSVSAAPKIEAGEQAIRISVSATFTLQ